MIRKLPNLNLLWILVLVLVISCQTSDPEFDTDREMPDPNVIATFEGGEITRDDLDRKILALPEEDRRPSEEGLEAWYEDLIEDLVIDHHLMINVAADEEEEMRLESFEREERRRLSVEVFLRDRLGPPVPVDERVARAYYNEHLIDWQQPASRLLSNIYLRSSKADHGRIEILAKEIRTRTLKGESFASLAEQYSNSESRHQGGELGWVKRKGLDPALVEVIFSLEEGVPSEPVITPGGIHLFMISGIVEAKTYKFEEVRQSIEGLITQKKREAAIDDLVASMELPENYFLAADEDLSSLVRAGNLEVPALQMGAFSYSVGQLRGQLLKTMEAGVPTSPTLPAEILSHVKRREQLFLLAEREAFLPNSEVDSRLNRALESQRRSMRKQRELRSFLESHPEWLKEWYEANQNQFMSPLRFRLRRLVLPLEPLSARQDMAKLGEVRYVAEPPTDLAKIAVGLGGQLTEAEWRTLQELARLSPTAARVAADLQPKELSPPYRTESTLERILVLEREEPRLQPLAVVFEDVLSSYASSHQAKIMGAWVQVLLEDLNLEIHRDQLVGPFPADKVDGVAVPERSGP